LSRWRAARLNGSSNCSSTGFGPEEAKALHISIARHGLAKFLAGQSEKPEVAIEVDGHEASSENQVQPFGIISYRFLRLPAVGRFAIATAREISPVESGRYKKSWFLLADGAKVSETAILANVKELVRVVEKSCREQPQSGGGECGQVRLIRIVDKLAVADRRRHDEIPVALDSVLEPPFQSGRLALGLVAADIRRPPPRRGTATTTRRVAAIGGDVNAATLDREPLRVVAGRWLTPRQAQRQRAHKCRPLEIVTGRASAFTGRTRGCQKNAPHVATSGSGAR
jgi:hypothetical protein